VLQAGELGDAGFQTDQPKAMLILIAAAIQKFVAIPAALLDIHPPTMPPSKSETTAATRRFLFILSNFRRFGSLARSQ